MEQEPYDVLGTSAGYEIGRRGALVILAHRGTRPAAIVAWIAGGLAGIAGVHAIVWPVLAVTNHVSKALGLGLGAGFAVAALLSFFVARGGYRRYRFRRDAPIDEVPGLCADVDAGVLRQGTTQVAELREVRIDTPFNAGDSTQGFMRWVRLSWPGGKARVYSANSRQAEAMARSLVELGVGVNR